MKRAMMLFLCLGCSSGTPGNDGGTGNDGGSNDAMGNPDVGTVNSCTTFTDDTTGTATITGPSGDTPAQYTPNCVKIKAGQSVTWNSNFTAHPLQPSAGKGTTPTPITVTSSGTTVTFAFPNPGTYSFECQVHPGIMNGAVEVVQ